MADDRLGKHGVVVFGGDGALGRAVVARLRADGALVAAGRHLPDDRDPDVDYVTVDALDESSVAATLAPAEGRHSAVVNLIGGYTPPQSLRDLDLGTLGDQIDINLRTAATITKYALRALAAGGGGSIVHTSSRTATQTGQNGFAYSVSKLGVIRLVETAAAEGRADGVRVNCILPSIIDTSVNRAAMPSAAHDTWPQPSEVAAVIAFLVSDDARLISGAAIPVYGLA